MTRQIIALGGSMASFAVANDGTGWFWNGERWEPWSRPDLPQPLPGTPEARAAVVDGVQAQLAREMPTAVEALAATEPKRGPGRPRKQP